jgi:hypothetical protein
MPETASVHPSGLAMKVRVSVASQVPAAALVSAASAHVPLAAAEQAQAGERARNQLRPSAP